jgi:hypothetical protein
MPQFQVHWYRTYNKSGSEMVEADSQEEAEEMIEDKIGELAAQGSLSLDPNGDEVNAIKVHQNIK